MNVNPEDWNTKHPPFNSFIIEGLRLKTQGFG